MRVAVVAALSIVLSGSALAARTETRHSLRMTEAAFYRVGLPFETDWTPSPANPYLVPASQHDPRQGLPTTLRGHLVGWAGGGSSVTFKTWSAWVFDDGPSAVSYAQWWERRCKPPQCNGSLLRANNVVYFGARFAAASRAMAQLRRR